MPSFRKGRSAGKRLEERGKGVWEVHWEKNLKNRKKT